MLKEIVQTRLFLHTNRFGGIALHHLLYNRSSAANGYRQIESPNSCQKHHHNIQYDSS